MTNAPSATPTVPALSTPRRLPRMQELGLVVVIVLLGIFLWLASGSVTLTLPAKEITDAAGHVQTVPMAQVQENKFLRINNLVPSVFTVMSWMAIMALGQTFVIISGGIDISVGSVMGLSAMVTALALEEFPPDASAWKVVPLGIAIPIGVGLVCGLINGSLVVGLRMHPFIVTLATLSIFRWGCLKIGAIYGSSLPWGDKAIPDGFADHFIAWQVPYTRYGGRISESLQFTPMLIMVAIVIIGWMYLRQTIWGRETYAIGGNEEAAGYSGIRVRWAKLRVYMISGMCAGIAGMITCGFYKSASTNTGEGYELNVIAAAGVGGRV